MEDFFYIGHDFQFHLRCTKRSKKFGLNGFNLEKVTMSSVKFKFVKYLGCFEIIGYR